MPDGARLYLHSPRQSCSSRGIISLFVVALVFLCLCRTGRGHYTLAAAAFSFPDTSSSIKLDNIARVRTSRSPTGFMSGCNRNIVLAMAMRDYDGHGHDHDDDDDPKSITIATALDVDNIAETDNQEKHIHILPYSSNRREFASAAVIIPYLSIIHIAKPAMASESIASFDHTTNDKEDNGNHSLNININPAVSLSSSKGSEGMLFLAALGMHWILWSISPMPVALAWDFLCIADVLYASTMKKNSKVS